MPSASNFKNITGLTYSHFHTSCRCRTKVSELAGILDIQRSLVAIDMFKTNLFEKYFCSIAVKDLCVIWRFDLTTGIG